MFDVNKAIYACDDVICREYFCESLHFFGWRTSKEGL